MKSIENKLSRGLAEPDTDNATIIGWYEKTSKYDPNKIWTDGRNSCRNRDRYQELDLINNGYKNGDWWNKPFYRWLENDRLIRTCSAQLSLTQQERAYAKATFHRFQGQKFGEHKEMYAVVTCLYAVEISEVDGRRAHPNVPDEKKPKEYWLGNLSQRFRIPEHRISSIYARIENWIRTDVLEPYHEFDSYREELPIEYKCRLTEVVI